MSETIQQPKEKLKLISFNLANFLRDFLIYVNGACRYVYASSVSDDAVSGVGTANQYIMIAILILGVVGNGASIVVVPISWISSISLKQQKYQH